MHFNLYFCHRIRPQIHFVISSFTSKKRNPETHDTHHLINLIYTMNKTDLVNAIAAAGLSKADSKKALDAALNAIGDALKANDKVALLGFGTFAVTERPGRQGINPATKEKIEIPAKKVIKF